MTMTSHADDLPAPGDHQMSPVELALVRFDDVLGAERAFTGARGLSTNEAP